MRVGSEGFVGFAGFEGVLLRVDIPGAGRHGVSQRIRYLILFTSEVLVVVVESSSRTRP